APMPERHLYECRGLLQVTPPSCIVLPFEDLVFRQFGANRSDIGKLGELHCNVHLMPRPIDQHIDQFCPHACPPSCIIVPHDDLDSGQFRAN
ncbi:Hypothetical predicted protein, partial [Olea europaea subsp. europaea]